MNKVMLVGNLTADPRLATTDAGKAYCRFSVAINRFSRSEEKKADFIPVLAWEQLASNCGKYLKKGSKVAVVGSLQINSYTDSQGVKRQSAEVRADSVEFLSPVGGNGGYSGNGYGNSASAEENSVLEEVPTSDDMPF